MLLEVLITASVMIVVGLAVFAAIDNATATSGQSKARAVAASLAQEDQERLRAMRPIDLANRHESRTRGSGAASYTVVSRGEPVSESGVVAGCTSGGSTNDLLIKISSTVSWPSMPDDRPVQLESVAAPPTGAATGSQGSLAISVTDRADQPYEDVPVTVTGGSSYTIPTNSLGCAFFPFLTAGVYNVSLSKPGSVDRDGREQVNDSGVTVTAGAITTRPYQFDTAGQIAVSFDTKMGANAPQAEQAEWATVSHTGLAASRAFGTGTAQATISATSLFPFPTGYGVYSGNCTAANPTLYDANYFSSNPGRVQVDPGGSYSVTVREPALNVRVVTGSGNTPIPASATARLRVRPTGTGCTTLPTRTFTTSPGGTFATGLPFGDYQVCADYNGRRRTLTSVQNRTAAGTPVQTLNTTTSGSQSGTCP